MGSRRPTRGRENAAPRAVVDRRAVVRTQRQGREAAVFRIFARAESARADSDLAHRSRVSRRQMRSVLFDVIAVASALAIPARGSAENSPQIPAPPTVAAKAWYVVGEDGAVVAAQDARASRPMASITKLMTAIVTLERARLSDVVTVDPRAARVGESTVYLRAGQRLTVEQLLRGTLVRSANDAAEALALYVGHGSQSRFVAIMNAKARQLGLTGTRYVNPHGLDARGHVSSARDTTQLLRYALGTPFIRRMLASGYVEVPAAGRQDTRPRRAGPKPPVQRSTASRCTAPCSEAGRRRSGTKRSRRSSSTGSTATDGSSRSTRGRPTRRRPPATAGRTSSSSRDVLRCARFPRQRRWSCGWLLRPPFPCRCARGRPSARSLFSPATASSPRPSWSRHPRFPNPGSARSSCGTRSELRTIS
ncbi:MAG: D-alanyl-D-alanine carboxypeptidase, partial [Actinobacteria bacterium]